MPRRRTGRHLLAALSAIVLCASGSAAANDSTRAQRRAFTVEDSIEWSNVLPFSAQWGSERKMALFSPDGSYALLRARRGDLEKNVNVDELLLYDMRQIQAYLRQPRSGTPPPPVVINTVEVDRDDDAPTAIQWVGASKVAFVARSPGGQRQAYVVDVTSKSVEQVTHSETDVMGFAYGGEVRAHFACIPYSPVKPLVVVVDGFDKALPSVENNSQTHCYPETPVTLLVSRGDGITTKVALPPMQLYPWLKRIWLSPDGNHAVVVAPAINAPDHWSAYTGPLRDMVGFMAKFTDATSMEMLNRTRYVLVDLRTGTTRPLLDAPNAQMAATNTPMEVFWTRGGDSVIITNTFLPLDDSDRDQRARRTQQPAIAEVNVQSGSVVPIAWEEIASEASARGRRIVGFDWSADSHELTIVYEGNDRSITRDVYRKQATRWKYLPNANSSPARIRIVEQQALNERPRIFVEAGRSGRRKLLLDPNPQAEQRTFAQAKVVHWTDASGLRWTAGLLLPTSYQPGQRYPLVVQTHGFNAGKFLLDGPTDGLGAGTAFAAQVLANSGFVVLQIEDHREAITFDQREGSAVAEGFRAGIEQLIRDGLADPRKVGLCAFSRTGLHALHLVARHPDMLAALTMSDTLTSGYSIFMYNVTQPAVTYELAKLSVAGRPTLDNIGAWFASEPLYALPKSGAAVRLEGMFQGLGMWEIYSVLKSAGRPVEYVLYPRGSHVLQKPRERLSSQGGNVDWFRFWLQDYEDPDPLKQPMYARWRELREIDASSAR